MIILTTLSLVAAAISGAIAWRVVRLDRLRSAARVSALEAAIDDHASSDVDFEWETLTPDPEPSMPFASISRQGSRQIGPLLTAAASLVVGVVLVVMMAMLADRNDRPASETAAPQAVELLSMSDSRDGSALVVNGLVRNPSRADTASLITVVTALDREGQIVASGSTTLTPVGHGKTVPFSVRVDNAGTAGRYRVSFKTSTGVMPHVDRRGGARSGSASVAE
jgi:hypothetical protein